MLGLILLISFELSAIAGSAAGQACDLATKLDVLTQGAVYYSSDGGRALRSKPSASKAKKVDREVREFLERSNVRFSEAKGFPSRLDQQYPALLDLSRTYVIHEAPGTGRRSMLEKALLHPDLPGYLSKLSKRGYTLLVDASLELEKKGGVQGFQSPSKKVIVIRPTTEWKSFVHEYEHVLFEEKVKKSLEASPFFQPVKDREADIARSQSLWMMEEPGDRVKAYDVALHRYVEHLAQSTDARHREDPTLRRLLDMYGKGVRTERALNESVATERVLEQLRSEGFTVLNEAAVMERYYQIENQLQGFGDTGSSAMTPAQRLLEKSLKRERLGLYAFLQAKAFFTNRYLLGAAAIHLVRKGLSWWVVRDGKPIHEIRPDELESGMETTE